MSTDGGLRQTFQTHIRTMDWQGVETWSTGQGVPDMNFSGVSLTRHVGSEGWIENKQCVGGKFGYETEQIGWIERRLRFGGRVFIAVRVMATAGPRKGAARDEVWLFTGHAYRALCLHGLPTNQEPFPEDRRPLYVGIGGSARWDWSEIRRLLVDFDFLSLSKGAIERNHIKGDKP